MESHELALTSESSAQNEERVLLEQALEPQERLFCYEYLVDFDHKRAAEKVGRSPNAGIRLLRKPSISKYIKLLTDELAAESLISREMVEYELLHNYLPMAKGDKEIQGVDRDGVSWSGRVTNMAAYKAALEMMAKHSGFTVPEVVKGGLTININHEAMGITIDGKAIEVEE